MCGIAGIIFNQSPERLNDIQSMTSSLHLRGPDDHGIWMDQEKGVALGFRRLSIIDLSQTGHQPMSSNSNRFVIVFNGEIYNFKEISAELSQQGWVFRGHSDTEVFLAAIETWGIEKSLKKVNGMFAFALWDKQDEVVYLVRDRFGEKPLYWGWEGNTLLFASEIKALKQYKKLHVDIDRYSLNLFMRYSYIPAPYTIFKNIEKVEPGHCLRIGKNKKVEKTTYWSANEVVNGTKDKPKIEGEEALKLLEKTLQKSISLRSISDVPLGTFLSGGIDSSLITAMMQANSAKPINTFTIGFSEQKFNEAPYAKAISAYLSTHHTELYVTNEHALNVIPKLPHLYDEPFADSSQIPTYLISQLARQSVTVCLSGDGGDELFGGYNRYTWGTNIYNNLSSTPSFLRHIFAQLFVFVNSNTYESTYNKLDRFLLSTLKVSALRHKMMKTSDVLRSLDSLVSFYTSLTSIIKNPNELVLESGNGHLLKHTNASLEGKKNRASWMMLEDVLTYLPGDILTKVDRASMGNGLETRMPFLDPHLFELSWRLPLSMKIRGKKGKIALREVLYKYVPQHLVERPKMGFGVPLGEWLLGPLKEWAMGLLEEKRLRAEGFLNPHVVKRYWEEHSLKKRDRTHELWNILMFQAWLEENKKFI